MPSTGRPDATGRSSGKLTGRALKAQQPPHGKPWVWHTQELLASPAWKAQRINGRRLIDFLLIEHMAHAGLENGNLLAPYDQLVTFGLARRLIWETIDRAEFCGLIRVKHGGRWVGTNQPSTYRLTFLSDSDRHVPTDEWKRVSKKSIKKFNAVMRQKIKSGSTTSGTTVVPQVALPNPNGRKPGGAKWQKAATSQNSP